jgi:nitroreductase
MDIYEALYTTRAMRRLKPDPVPDDVIGRILDAGLRAPTGGNAQDWRFVTVTDRETIAAMADHYRRGLAILFGGHYKASNDAVKQALAEGTTDRRTLQVAKVLNSTEHLAANFQDVPLLVFGFSQTDQNPGSIWPSLWSMCLAARAEGVGSTVTTVLSMYAHDEVNALLGVPEGKGWIQHGCLPMGYPLGRWGMPDRKPISKVVFHNQWGSAAEFPTPEPPTLR